MAPRDLAFEALSAITGYDIKSIKDFNGKNPGKAAPDTLSPQDVLNMAVLACLQQNDFLEKLIERIAALSANKPLLEATLIRRELFVNEEDFFDQRFDYDFTNINDGAAQFKRGNESYKRPCGWNRIALKVLDKYEDGNGWLGIGPNAWPVSYHGTSIEGAKGIIQDHYKAGLGQANGRGVYSTPDLATALTYSKTFTSKATKKTYNVILQNRINQQKRVITPHNYWLVPVPEGTSADEEKKIVESAIRPYGLLLREVK